MTRATSASWQGTATTCWSAEVGATSDRFRCGRGYDGVVGRDARDLIDADCEWGPIDL